MFRQAVFRAGNSLCISIPSKVVKKFGIESGQKVQVDVLWEESSLKVHFDQAHQLPLIRINK